MLDVQYLFSNATYKHKWLDLRKLISLLREKTQEADIVAYVLSNQDKPSPVEKILVEQQCKLSVKRVKGRPSAVFAGIHDVRIALDAVGCPNEVEKVVLVTGKSNFADLVQDLHIKGKKVAVWAFRWSLADFLVSVVDEVVLLDELDGVLQESRK
jgi:uncharacterized LabA/DUF88 family protein